MKLTVNLENDKNQIITLGSSKKRWTLLHLYKYDSGIIDVL